MKYKMHFCPIKKIASILGVKSDGQALEIDGYTIIKKGKKLIVDETANNPFMKVHSKNGYHYLVVKNTFISIEPCRNLSE